MSQDYMENSLYLFDLSGKHAALYTQYRGDVDVLPAHVVHPLGEAVDCGLEELPGELYDVEYSLDDVVWGEGIKDRRTRSPKTIKVKASLENMD